MSDARMKRRASGLVRDLLRSVGVSDATPEWSDMNKALDRTLAGTAQAGEFYNALNALDRADKKGARNA